MQTLSKKVVPFLIAFIASIGFALAQTQMDRAAPTQINAQNKGSTDPAGLVLSTIQDFGTNGGHVFNVVPYGATGNGTTDDTSAIEAAIAAAGASNQGGIVFFPCTVPSYYKVASGPIVISTKVHLQGCLGSSIGSLPGRIVSTSTTNDLFQFAVGSPDSEIDHLELIGPGCNFWPSCIPGTSGIVWYSTGGAGIDLSGMGPGDGQGEAGIRIHDVTISGFYNGIAAANGNRFYIDDVRLNMNANDGWYHANGIDVYASNVESVYNNRAGYEIIGGAGFYWDSITAYGNPYGFILGGTSTTSATYFFGRGLVADTNTTAAYYVGSATGNVGPGVIECDQCWAAGTSGGPGISLWGTGGNQFSWRGGWIRGNYGPGVNMAAPSTSTTFANANFSANGENNTAQSGISVAAGVSNFWIIGNIFGNVDGDTGNQATGITVASGSSNNYVIALNTLITGTSTLVSDGGTGSNKLVMTGNNTFANLSISGQLGLGSLLSSGTKATLSGTGACSSLSGQTGGPFAGQVECNGTTGASTLTITPGYTAPNGYACFATSPTGAGYETVDNVKFCTMSFSSVTSTQWVQFGAIAF